MKKLFRRMLKALARFLLSYAGRAVAWMLDRAAGRVAGKTLYITLLTFAEDLSEVAAMFAAAVKDGDVSEDERDSVADAAQRVADRAKEMLK